MDKFSRVIFALLFLIASLGSEIVAKGASAITPMTAAKAQGRSLAVGRLSTPLLMDDSIRMDEHPLVDQSKRAEMQEFPCASLQVTEAGAVCDGYRLDFPEVNLKEVLEGGKYLPRQSESVFISEKAIGNVVYRNLTLVLRWEPTTPEFLQMHLEAYLPYWENRIPYRLFWNAQYEMCSESCSTLNDEGEFLPADVEDLAPSLAADSNFNGVPASFWNENIEP